MLKIEDLEVSYGAVQALRGISMEVNDGEIVSLIGANGAGKTTTLHAITGLVPIRSGSVIYDGHDLRKTDPSRIVTMGLAHVPEGRQVFTRMTVAENLAMGAYFRKDKKAIADDLERVYARFPRLKERAKQLAGTLSGGEQQMLAMGRAIMSAPKLIVMDEPSMGCHPCSCRRCFPSSARCMSWASRPCSWSRTRRWRSPSPTVPMCSKTDASPCPAAHTICCTTTRSGRPISAREYRQASSGGAAFRLRLISF